MDCIHKAKDGEIKGTIFEAEKPRAFVETYRSCSPSSCQIMFITGFLFFLLLFTARCSHSR